jgi:hypothetical protein
MLSVIQIIRDQKSISHSLDEKIDRAKSSNRFGDAILFIRPEDLKARGLGLISAVLSGVFRGNIL